MAENTDRDVIAGLLAADERRVQATLAKSRDGLEAAYGADLVYHHASGRIDDKKSLVEFLINGPVSYRGYRRDTAQARIFGEVGGEVGTLTGRFSADITVNGADRALAALYASVWIKRGADWQMIVWQATPVQN